MTGGDSGLLLVTVESGKGLKERHWNCRQDPYCVVRLGRQEVRTRAVVDGGRDLVWNQTVQLRVTDQDNAIHIDIQDDSSLGKDEHLGTAKFDLKRLCGSKTSRTSHHMTSAVLSHKSGKQHGTLTVSVTWQHSKASETDCDTGEGALAASTAGYWAQPHSSGPAAGLPRYINYAPAGSAPIFAQAPVDSAWTQAKAEQQPQKILLHQPAARSSLRGHGGAEEMISHALSNWRERHHPTVPAIMAQGQSRGKGTPHHAFVDAMAHHTPPAAPAAVPASQGAEASFAVWQGVQGAAEMKAE